MSLDQNLFTLVVTPSTEDPNVVDLVEPNGTIHYRKQRTGDGSSYHAQVYDFMSQSLLADVKAPSSTSKVKTIELYNPTTSIELKYTGTLTFRWSFAWETHEFEWKREECFLIRKPDPPVLVAITKEPPGRLKTTSIQILDYNLNRFDIDDRKGLEIVILTSLLTFSDSNEVQHTPTPKSTLSTPTVLEPPPLPSKPDPKSGVDRIAELQAARGEVNEVTVEPEGEVNDYAAYVDNLLRDDSMLIVTVRSDSVETVPKVLRVVEQVKRARHKAGIEEQLHQYVLYDTVRPKGPKRINLDDAEDGKGKIYIPPNSLTIHLSKIPMPELEPKPQPNPSSPIAKNASSFPLDKKAPMAPPASAPPLPPAAAQTRPQRLSPPLTSANERSEKLKKLTRGGGSFTSSLFRRETPSSGSHIHSHQVHPTQPSPSPAQLAHPGIYAAPPPPPPHSPSVATRPASGSFFDLLHRR